MELAFLDWLRGRLPASPGVPVGVGDDAAVVDLGASSIVVTTDLIVDGVHFLSASHAPERIGHKALGVNLSDLAAMGAEPRAAVASLALPRAGAAGFDAAALARRLIEGMLPLAARFGCPLVGGDTNVSDGPLTVAITAIGVPAGGAGPEKLVRRDGAHPGDAIFVTGALGGSLLGRHLDFTPRVAEALWLVRGFSPTAMIDVTDGLALDLARVARASRVGAELEAEAIPVSPDAVRRARETGRAPLDHALGDGEDFELLFTLPEAEAERLAAATPPACGLTRIGRVVAGEGVALRSAGADAAPLEPRGFEHR